MNENFPRFVVLLASRCSKKADVQALSAKTWSSGFLPGEYAGVSLRSGSHPVPRPKAAITVRIVKIGEFLVAE